MAWQYPLALRRHGQCSLTAASQQLGEVVPRSELKAAGLTGVWGFLEVFWGSMCGSCGGNVWFEVRRGVASWAGQRNVGG